MSLEGLKSFEQAVEARLRRIDVDAAYDEFLDECYGEASIAGYTYSTSRALKEIDPIAYRCGKSDFISSEIEADNWIEINDEYYYAHEINDLKEELEEYLEEQTEESNL